MFQTEIEGVKVFTVVRALARHRVVDISMHNFHSAVVVEPGHIYTFGRNTEGQLGNGNTRPQNAIVEVKVSDDKTAFVRACWYFPIVEFVAGFCFRVVLASTLDANISLLLQRVQCGEFYCVAGATSNDLLFWGTRFKNPPRFDESWGGGLQGRDGSGAGSGQCPVRSRARLVRNRGNVCTSGTMLKESEEQECVVD